MADMVQWIRGHDTALWWLAAASLLTFGIGVVAVPCVIARIPADYFARPERQPRLSSASHPIVRVLLLVAKNALGVAFILGGILMLLLPGQGLLTLLIGIMLLDFPGKYLVERWVIAQKPVLRSINWIRKRAGKEPLLVGGQGTPVDAE